MTTGRIPNNLKKYRQIIGYSQKQVALLLGFAYEKNISRWEMGVISPSIAHLFLLSHLYNVSPNELYPILWNSSKKELAERKLPPSSNKKKGVDYFYL